MKKYLLLYLSIFILITLAACAPKVAYQAQDSLNAASNEASNQAIKMKKAKTGLKKEGYKMRGDIQRIKEAERLFDQKSGIVLSY